VSEQRTEQATEQRKQKARQKGDVVRSRELLSSAAMLAGLLVLGIAAKQFVNAWTETYTRTLALGTGDLQTAALDHSLLKLVAPALAPIAVVLAAAFAAALLSGIGQSGGVQFRGDVLAFKFDRLNPVTNLSNIFSLRSAARIAKSLLPAAIVVVLGVAAIKQLILPMPVMSMARLPLTLEACYGIALKTAWIMLAWSAIDYAVERAAWNKRLRMTKQELRDEMKEAMGNPQVKGRIRRIQNAMRRRRVKADVSRASVVITNPTHYAVALEFSFDTMLAPTLLTKGRNLHALKIREEARLAGVPIIENPPLARSLYKSVDEGHSIPYELYAAVAAILAWLYRQQVEKAARDRKAAEESRRASAVVPSLYATAGARP
jgi:flagellar biosynthetic protein FlhB